MAWFLLAPYGKIRAERAVEEKKKTSIMEELEHKDLKNLRLARCGVNACDPRTWKMEARKIRSSKLSLAM